MSDFEKLKNLDPFQLNLKLYYAAHNGELEVVKYIIKEIRGSSDADSINYAFTSACDGNQLAVMNYLLVSDDLQYHAEVNSDNYSAFFLACEKSLDAVKFLIPLLKFDTEDKKEYIAECAMFKACEGGNLELVKYLFSEKTINEHFDISKNIEDVISASAIKGHIDIFEYLLNLENTKDKILNSDDLLEEIILNCFTESRFEMIEHLLNHNDLKEHIDIHKDNDKLFKFLCEQGGEYEIEYLVNKIKIERTKDISKMLVNPDYVKYNKLFEKRDLNSSLSKELQYNQENKKRPKV